jgi:hypothetical protein
MPPELLIARLILVHLLGDFLLQPSSWVRDREARSFRSPWLYMHALVHLLLATVMTGSLGILPILIGLGHLLFDGLKAYFRLDGLLYFLTDQLLHVLVILFGVASLSQAVHWEHLLERLGTPRHLWVVSGYLAVTTAYSRMVAIATAPWRSLIPAEREPLKNAGRWIGIIERILVLTFVLLGQLPAVGFLLAAKSVFRFGDLRESKDKGHTEYVMIGTLLSFGVAILTGLIIQRLIH